MLYLCTAFYAEAAPFIEALSCKKDSTYTHSQVFVSENALVLVTGSGSLSAAVTLTELLAKCPPHEGDLLLNVGICGCTDCTVPIGQLYRIPKITDTTTDFDYYPDLLYSSRFPELPLVTSTTPVELRAEAPHKLYDMEAAGLFFAARRHFPAHCMFFYKIVSDHCDGTSHLTTDGVSSLIAPHVAGILSELPNSSDVSFVPFDFTPEDEQFLRMLSEKLQCSVTMTSELRKLLLYYELEHGGAVSFTENFMNEQGIFLEDADTKITRKRGKQLLEQLRNACLE